MKLKVGATFFLSIWFVAFAFGLTHVTSQAITNSTVDSTPIGGSVAAAAHFTTLNASGAIVGGSGISGVSTSASGQPASVSGTSAGYTGWGKNGTGDMDFIAANNGTSPSFYWYFLLGSSTVTPEMWLDQSALLHVPGGVTGNLTGNVTGNVTGNLTGNASGTASALAANPSTCSLLGEGTGGILASGAPSSCQTAIYSQKGTVSFPAETFTSSSITHFTNSFSLAATPATGYVVVCTPQSDFGDETQYSCWASGSTLFIKITHSATGLPFTSNAVSVNYMVMQ